MKLLIVHDLHGVMEWYDWLIQVADQHDGIVVSGDILNGFDNSITQQITDVYSKLICLSTLNKNIFMCSGNHDMNNDDALSYWKKLEVGVGIEKYIAPLVNWFDIFKPNIHVDNENVIFNDILFTTFMNNEFHIDEVEKKNNITLEESLKLRVNCNKWAVIHHSPPINSVLCASFPIGGCEWIRKLVELHSPTYLFSGHIHGAPFVNGGKFFEVINKTICFNGGSSLDRKFHVRQNMPCHIILDTDTNEVKWFNNKTYIKEKL